LQAAPLIERALRVRQNPVSAYGAALLIVALATMVRWLLGGEVMEGLPFITYFPAIVITAIVSGFWPAVLVTLLSSLIAWYVFLPPYFDWGMDQRGAISLALFVMVAGVNIALVALLNRALDRIVAQEQNVRVLIDSAPNGIVVVNEEGKIQLINASTERLFGYSREELLGQNVEMLVPERQAKGHRALRESFHQNPETRPMGAGRDLSGRRKDGSEFPIEIGLNPVGQDGNAAVLATVIDISERKQAHDRQQLLIGELHHRTQNLFAVVQAIAARSFTEGHTQKDAKEIFSGRLQALARAHSMLAEAAWKGAPLDEIVNQECAAFSKHLSVSGCDIVVNEPAAQQFALIIHELATNALKHGALSARGGRVAIEGKVERLNGDSIFSFAWTESGGPPVSKPMRTGFGSIILLEAAKQFGQDVALDFDPQGLSYKLRLSLSAIKAVDIEARAAAGDLRSA
jgi:PAS domain S-box-containing protein